MVDNPVSGSRYVHNNIFFSFAVDADLELLSRKQTSYLKKTLTESSSGDSEVNEETDLEECVQATYASSNNDLNGTKAYQEADVPGLYNLSMAIVDFRGHRVVAQSILPGILQGDKSESLLYGSLDNGKNIFWNQDFHSKILETSKRLRMKKHMVLDGSGHVFQIAAPVECKGIIGSDDGMNQKIRQLFKNLFLRQINPRIYGLTLMYLLNLNWLGLLRRLPLMKKVYGSSYLKDTVLPKFIQDLCTLKVSPIDGQTLIEELHAHGINVRYLGKVADGIKHLPHLWDLCSNEIIVRCAKHIIKDILRDAADHDIRHTVAHFFSCLFGDCQPASGKDVGSKTQAPFTSLSSKSLRSDILEFAKVKYQFELAEDAMSHVKKYSVIRNFCLKVGVTIIAKIYDLICGTPFQTSDILDLQSVVKHSIPVCAQAKQLVESGKVQLAQGMLDEAYAIFTQAFTILQQVTGPMHREVANCCRYLATVLYQAGDMDAAISQQRKELIINERCLGLDHPDTAYCYGTWPYSVMGTTNQNLHLDTCPMPCSY